MQPKRIKVLVVDDSTSVRQTMKDILQSDPEIEVIATAADPFIAAKHIAQETPDVITLDVEMPRMDGLTFLDKIMRQHPIPIVMCSSLTTAGSQTALTALERGAVDIIEKPLVGTKAFLEESCIRICDSVKSAAKARLRRNRAAAERPHMPMPKLSADVIIPAVGSQAMIETTEKIIVVGASTGGTEALRVILQAMPANAPGMVIVQHMPERFTACFAQRLNQLCSISVKEAADNDTVLRGQALIAPGNKHTLLKRSGARYYVEVREGPLVSRHRPSVDVLFRSAARCGGKNVTGVIMTGMGDDGAHGMKEMHEVGAMTLAQDEESCVVFGMPKEAIRLGGVRRTLPLEQLPAAMLHACQTASTGSIT